VGRENNVVWQAQVTTTAILAKLEAGACTYAGLPKLPNLDYLLRGLLRSGDIVRVTNGNVTYSLPPKPRKELPLEPSKVAPDPPEKACARCEVTKPIEQFTRDGVGRSRRATCSECLRKLRKQRYEQETQKSNAKVCRLCEKKRRIGHFGFSGKNRSDVCFYCREKQLDSHAA
jgi:hypothetical protein